MQLYNSVFPMCYFH